MSLSKIMIAEHLLNNSYPALGDPKVLLAVLQNVRDALDEKFTQILTDARDKKEIPPFSNTFNGKIAALRQHPGMKKKLTPIDFMLISEIQELLVEQERAPVEFRRKDAYIIADDEYHLHALTPQKTKTYIDRAKSLLSRL